MLPLTHNYCCVLTFFWCCCKFFIILFSILFFFFLNTFFLFNIPLLAQSISHFLICHGFYCGIFSDMSRHSFAFLNFKLRYDFRLQPLGYRRSVTVELVTMFTGDFCIWDSEYVRILDSEYDYILRILLVSENCNLSSGQLVMYCWRVCYICYM